MKFRLKITICMVWMLALALGIGGSMIISLSFENMLAHEEQNAAASYQMTLQTLQLVNSVSTQKDFSNITATFRQLQTQAAYDTARLRQDSEVLYESGSLLDQLVPVTSDTSHCTAALLSTDAGEKYLQMSGVFEANDKTLYLDLVFDISAVYATRAEQQTVYERIFLVTILLGAALSWTIAYFLTRPLSRLSAATRKLAGGRLSTRVKIKSKDELGSLAEDFNQMAGQLEANVNELTSAMERQEQFMGSFAHEMKTPMTSVIGYADLLRSDSLNPEEARDAANYIFSEGKRLESLSLKLLDLLVMDNQEITFVRTEPAQMISSLVRHLRPVYAERNIRLQYQCAAGSCMLEPDLVKSLLTNLLDNARKALENGGNIYIVSDWLDDACRIRVLDNGRGIPKEALEHITEAFYRVDKSRSRKQGGVGLGLTLCNRIAALHNGSISFDSRIGNGTCVTVLLRGGAK